MAKIGSGQWLAVENFFFLFCKFYFNQQAGGVNNGPYKGSHNVHTGGLNTVFSLSSTRCSLQERRQITASNQIKLLNILLVTEQLKNRSENYFFQMHKFNSMPKFLNLPVEKKVGKWQYSMPHLPPLAHQQSWASHPTVPWNFASQTTFWKNKRLPASTPLSCRTCHVGCFPPACWLK